jgi:hypothetical protein
MFSHRVPSNANSDTSMVPEMELGPHMFMPMPYSQTMRPGPSKEKKREELLGQFESKLKSNMEFLEQLEGQITTKNDELTKTKKSLRKKDQKIEKLAHQLRK